MALTPKQERFVEEYLIDLNATQAAKRAGYSEDTAYSQGQRLLKNDEVKSAVDRLQSTRSEKRGIDAQWVLDRLQAEAEADIADLYDENTGALLPVHKWPKIWRQGLVQGIEVEELFDGRGSDRVSIGLLRKVKLDSRIKRVELVGKHVGVKAFEETVVHKGLDGLAERFERAMKRGGK